MIEYCQIELTRGQVTMVSPEDWEKLRHYHWQAYKAQSGDFYAQRAIVIDGKKTSVFMHREIMEAAKGMQVDHIDTDSLNNMRSNLRLATHSENNRNKHISSRNTSGYKGVSWHRAAGKWHATIRAGAKRGSLGLHATPELAYKAYCAAALEYHGKFARLA